MNRCDEKIPSKYLRKFVIRSYFICVMPILNSKYRNSIKHRQQFQLNLRSNSDWRLELMDRCCTTIFFFVQKMSERRGERDDKRNSILASLVEDCVPHLIRCTWKSCIFVGFFYNKRKIAWSDSMFPSFNTC